MRFQDPDNSTGPNKPTAQNEASSTESFDPGAALPDLRSELESTLPLPERSARSVADVLRSIRDKAPVHLPPSLKIELEQDGYLSSMTVDVYRRELRQVEDLPHAKTEYASADQALTAVKASVAELKTKLISGWHCFWSRSETLENERTALAGLKRKVMDQEQRVTQLRKNHETLRQLEKRLGEFTATTEGYLSLADKGQRLLTDLEGFGDSCRFSFKAVMELLDAADRVFKVYTDVADSHRLDARYAGALAEIALALEVPLEMVIDTCDQLRIGAGDDALLLTRVALKHQLPPAEALKLYNDCLATDKLYSWHHAPLLISAALDCGVAPSKAIDYCRAVYDQLGPGYVNANDAATLTPVGLKLKLSPAQAAQHYRDFGATGRLYWSHHAAPLTVAALLSNQSMEQVMKVYESFIASTELHDKNEAPLLTIAALLSNREPIELLGLYAHFCSSHRLCSARHAVTLTVMAVDISTADKAYCEAGGHVAHSVSHHSYSYDSHSSSGFSLMGATAGDLIDNGHLDMSGGFLAGGLLGGLLDRAAPFGRRAAGVCAKAGFVWETSEICPPSTRLTLRAEGGKSCRLIFNSGRNISLPHDRLFYVERPMRVHTLAVLVASLTLMVETAVAVPKLCVKSSTGEILVRNKCKNTETRLNAGNIVSLVGGKTYFVTADENGTVMQGTGNATVTRSETGVYSVDFGVSLDHCTMIANSGMYSNNGIRSGVTVASSNGTTSAWVYVNNTVYPYDKEDSGFNLAVFCPE